MEKNEIDIVSKWVKRWEEVKVFEADPDPKRGKVFVTFPYPYMNGPLHVGHVFSASRVDAYARFKRMQGYNVLFPWAWHWTGQPIVSAVQRFREGDPIQTKIFVDMDKVPPEELKNFVDPVYVASYYTKENKETVKKLGFSVDWRREFHTSSHEPLYSRFIEWQYNKLKELGYVAQGTHPVVWCPRDQSPTQDHDRLEGEGVAPEEYILMKFEMKGDDAYLVAGTLRPETIFGVTNVWVKPDGEYVKAAVDGEIWIISKEAADKLENQLKKVTVKQRMMGEELLGRYCKAPMVNREVPILPASFVNTSDVTGVVYSVPAHAPYDWLGLRDLASQTLLRLISKAEEYRKMAESIKPISMISLPGFGEYPAIEIVEKLKVKDQNDPLAEEATKEIYNKEFHQGKMKENCERYSGMPVSEAKAKIIEELVSSGKAERFYDLPERVVCRCGTECVVRVLKDQWFLKYSDPEWKDKSAQAINRANVFPPEARQQFIQTIYWLKEYPCARKTGLGTPLPWDREWLVETLSDSTIYMAFYTIVQQLRSKNVTPQQLTDEVLDYIFLGKGEPEKIARISGLNSQLITNLRQEFLYWYPVDLRNSGKDLVSNHLTFFIMHHVALFEEEFWPRGVGVNGMVQLEGARMSKSHGVFISAKDAIATYGSDATRATLLSAAESLDDPDWRSSNAEGFMQKFLSMPDMITQLLNEAEEREMNQLDRWLLSKLQRRIKAVTDSLEVLRTRTAFFNAYFATFNDLKWYLRRTKPGRGCILRFFDTWARLLSPFTPFLAEEMNERIGGRKIVSSSLWPSYDEKMIDVKAEYSEELISSVIQDIKDIKNVLKGKFTSARIIVASEDIIQLLKRVLSMLKEGKKEGDVISSIIKLSKNEDKQRVAREVQAMIKFCRDEGIDSISSAISAGIDEANVLKDASEFIRKEVSLDSIQVELADSEMVKKGRFAMPMRPLIIMQ